MMFRRSGDVLDLTDMQRRGLLKVKESERKSEMPGKVNSQGYFELSGNSSNEDIVPTRPSSVTPEPPSSFSTDPFGALDNPSSQGSGLGFLDSLAATAPVSTASSAVDNLEVQGLKNKIDDLEYKIERLMEKISKLEDSNI